MIDKSNSQLLRKLEEIGLSPKEALVYLDLVGREGVTGTSKIVQSTGLHGQFVYNALDTLEKKGLATHVVVGRRKKFAAVHPSRLMYLADQQKRLVTEVIQDLSVSTRKNIFQDFEFYLGAESFIAHEFDEVDAAEEAEEWQIIAGNNDRFYSIFYPKLLKEYDDARAKKRITIRCIISSPSLPAHGTTSYTETTSARPYFELRSLTNFGLGVINTVTRPHSYSMSTFTEKELTYKVINDDVARSYREFFTALWNISEKV